LKFDELVLAESSGSWVVLLLLFGYNPYVKQLEALALQHTTSLKTLFSDADCTSGLFKYVACLAAP